MVDACAMRDLYYGPFGDIADVVACEDQFRNAFLLGCVGAWTLHPAQIAIAKRVFGPSARDVAHARRVKAAMGDGTGAVMLDGKMEDDASLKQCLVILELADRLAANDPELADLYTRAARHRASRRRRMSDDTAYRPRRSVLYMPGNNERSGEGTHPAGGRADPRPRGRGGPGPQGGCARHRLQGSRRCLQAARGDDPRQRLEDAMAQEGRPRGSVCCPANGIVVPKVDSAEGTGPGRAMDRSAPAQTRLWAMIETPGCVLDVRAIATASSRLTVLVLGVNDLVKELGSRHVPGRRPCSPRCR